MRVRVKATDPERVGVWDRDPEQVDGEVMVRGEATFEVELTPGVVKALSAGTIAEVKPTPAPKSAKK